MSSDQGSSAGRRVAFEAAALPHLRAVYGAARRLTRTPEDANDLVQETFLRAYRTFDNFVPGTNAKAWLLRIAYSIFTNQYHRARRAPDHVPFHEMEERLPSRGFSPDAISAADLEWCLDRLADPFRPAVLLVDVEGLSYEEAAAALSCPVGTLRSRLSRGRRLLAALVRQRLAPVPLAVQPSREEAG